MLEYQKEKHFMQKLCTKYAPHISPRPLLNLGECSKTANAGKKQFGKYDIVKDDYPKKPSFIFSFNLSPFLWQNYKNQKGPGTS